MKRPLVLAFAFLLLAAATFPVLAAEDGGPSCGQLLLARCETCHYNSRTCQQLGKKSKWRWQATVRVMAKKGAKLTKEEQKQLADCLYRQTDDIKLACSDPGAIEPWEPPPAGEEGK